MARNHRYRFGIGLIAAAALAVGARAQGANDAGEAPTALPAERNYEGIRYLTGGVTLDEADLFRAHAHQYPLVIELVEKQAGGRRDAFTADALVNISLGAVTMLEARTDGPFMFVRLTPGTYTITAKLANTKLRKSQVRIDTGKTTRIVFTFPIGTDQ